MLGNWAVLTLTGALYSSWQSYGGRAFAATLTAFAFFFLVMLLFAARGAEDSFASRFGAGSGYLLGAAVFLVYLIYGLGTNTFAFTRAAAVAGLVLIPLGLAASVERKPPAGCFRARRQRSRLAVGDRSHSYRNLDCERLAGHVGLLPSHAPTAYNGPVVPA